MSILIKEVEIETLHFVGIFGVGMSAIAQYLAPEVAVTGSDRGLHSEHTSNLRKKLQECHCTLSEQDGSGITQKTSAIVISTAIEPNNADYQKAVALNIPILHRSEVLASLVAANRTISVTGTSGKSTVSSMIFHTLTYAGLSPSYIGGANLHSLKEQGLIGNAYRGSSDILIIEADESDGTVVNYYPETTLILNISKDHKSEEEILSLMKRAAAQSKSVVYNSEDPLLQNFEGTTFGFDQGDFHLNSIDSSRGKNCFTINDREFSLRFPGKHTIANTLATAATTSLYDVPLSQCAQALNSYTGIERRFDIYESEDSPLVIDDYAHNPEKVAAAIEAARSLHSPLTVIFQPHGFGPLRFLLQEFAQSFTEATTPKDTLIFLPVYYAGGTVDRSVDSTTLSELIAPLRHTFAVSDRDEALKIISDANNGVVLLLGARDQSLPAFAKEISSTIQVSNNE